jgi:hypothetical protein
MNEPPKDAKGGRQAADRPPHHDSIGANPKRCKKHFNTESRRLVFGLISNTWYFQLKGRVRK